MHMEQQLNEATRRLMKVMQWPERAILNLSQDDVVGLLNATADFVERHRAPHPVTSAPPGDPTIQAAAELAELFDAPNMANDILRERVLYAPDVTFLLTRALGELKPRSGRVTLRVLYLSPTTFDALTDLMRVLGDGEVVRRMMKGTVIDDDLGRVLLTAKAEVMGLRAERTRDKIDEEDEHFAQEDVNEAVLFPAAPMLRRMADTYRERRGTYGPSEQRFADVAMAMFPQGLTLRTREDWVRYGLLHQLLSKLARYAKDFHQPHVDSIHDVGPYAAMLEAEDRRLLNMEPFAK
jgi:hypothetical protein